MSESLAPVRSIKRLLTIVRYRSQPAKIRIELFQGIRSLEDQRNLAKNDDAGPFQPVKYAQIFQGSLRGLESLISRVSKRRVIVLLQLLGYFEPESSVHRIVGLIMFIPAQANC